MSEDDVRELAPGDRVHIVSRWSAGCGENTHGLMDKYLGKDLTVKYIHCDGHFVKVEEDQAENGGEGWYWYAPAIEYAVSETETVFKQPTRHQVASFLLRRAGKEAIHG